jgi:hypothetical protein
LKRGQEPLAALLDDNTQTERVEYGVDYARAVLRDIADLTLTDRLTILRDVEQGLEDALSGRESERLVQRRVDEILDDELGEDPID